MVKFGVPARWVEWCFASPAFANGSLLYLEKQPNRSIRLSAALARVGWGTAPGRTLDVFEARNPSSIGKCANFHTENYPRLTGSFLPGEAFCAGAASPTKSRIGVTARCEIVARSHARLPAPR